MADIRQPEGNRVFCHQCEHEWDRYLGGLTCPFCGSEFVEILSADTPPSTTVDPFSPPPVPTQPFHGHNPWGDSGNSGTWTFGGGRGRVSFSSRSYTTSSGAFGRVSSHRMQNDMNMPGFFPFGFPAQPAIYHGGYTADGSFRGSQQVHVQPANLQDLFSLVFQTMQHPSIQHAGPAGPFAMLNHMMNPAVARQGDAVWTQEQFDQIMTQLMEQNASHAPGPASEKALNSLPDKKVTAEMMGDDGQAECSICMDNVEIGTDVTTLPCNHWFHKECVVAWLKEHDTCPHCRQPISKPQESAPTPRPEASRRRSSRRSNSVASPLSAPVPDYSTHPNASTIQDTTSGVRDARQSYGNRQEPDYDQIRTQRANSSPNIRRATPGGGGNRNEDEGDGLGAALSDAASWIRNRLSFGR